LPATLLTAALLALALLALLALTLLALLALTLLALLALTLLALLALALLPLLALALLTLLTLALLTLLTLALLTLLALALLTLLPLALLTALQLAALPVLPRLIALLTALRAHLLHLLAQPFHLPQGLLGELGIVFAAAAFAILGHRLLDLLQLLAKLIDALGYRGFRHYRIAAHTATDPIRVALHIALDLCLLQFAESFPHLGGSLLLRILKIANRTLHALFEALQILGFALFFPSELIGLFAGQPRAIRAEGLAHLSFERLLAPGEIIRLT
jgi:hypothetical protein